MRFGAINFFAPDANLIHVVLDTLYHTERVGAMGPVEYCPPSQITVE